MSLAKMDDLTIIQRPIVEVFAFVSNHANDKLWKPFVTESRQLSAGGIGVGTRFEVVTVAGGYRRAGEVEVLEYKPHYFHVYRANDRIFPFVAQLSFEPLASGTVIRGQVEFQARGVWRIPAILPWLFFRRQSGSTFARLKQVMESS